MRLHRLQMTAFGPFAGTETIDFDALADAGLYLIQGPTGAGKTSVLDAICFALYAAVPGSRARSRGSLHSDHADPQTAPQVVLELTVAGRRLRLTRSPEFSRPKKRGTGETTVPARVALQERVAGRWEDKGTRIDEVALVIKDVVGLGLEQFVKVVLLPQGAFATFLRASPEDRRGLLERLFDTSRFTDIESWLTDRRRASAGTLDAVHDRLRGELRRVDDLLVELAPVEAEPVGATGSDPVGDPTTPPGDWPVWDQLAPDETAGALLGVTGRVSELASAALAQADAADGRLDLARTAVEQARRGLEHRAVGLRAQAVLATLEEQAELWTEARRQLHEADRAREVSGHITAFDRASAGAREATDRVESARQQLESACPTAPWCTAPLGSADASAAEPSSLKPARPISTVSMRAALTGVVDGSALLAAASAAEQRAVVLASTRREQLERVAQHEHALARLREAAGPRETQRQDLQTEQDAVRAEAGRLPERYATVARLGRATTLQDSQESDARAITILAQTVQSRAKQSMATEAAAIQLRLRRLAGMAGELAEQLVDGEDCPVCGSTEHPRPASGDAQVEADDIEQAEALATAARSELAAAEQELATLEARRGTRAEELADILATLGQQATTAAVLPVAGSSIDEVGSFVARATAAATASVAAAQIASDRLPVVISELEELAHAEEVAQGARESLQNALSAAQTRSQTASEELDLTGDRIRELIGEHQEHCPCAALPAGQTATKENAHPHHQISNIDRDAKALGFDLSAIQGRHGPTQACLESVLAALTARDRAVEVLEQARRDLEAALAAKGLTDMAAVRAASLPDDEVTSLRARLRELQRQRDTAEAECEKPDVIAALSAPEPDLAGLEAGAAAARESCTEVRRGQGLLERADRRLRELGTAIVGVLGELGPAAAEHALVAELADCASGNGADNLLRMRLSSFVLAARLEEIARYANERLEIMSDGRYALQHSAGLAAHGARSGLGLRVVDAWTGIARDTATLSGGEAFMASLALALGLGDAVRAEAGGLDLQTLFVDEGFGSLDEESLEQVMAVLDALREGGRSVGIVSHVPELRQRIQAQVRVTKTAAGSHVTVHAGGLSESDEAVA